MNRPLAAGFDAGALAEIPKALQAVADQNAVSGFVTLVWRDGEIVQLNTIGRRDVAAGAPMQRDTIFRIASMSKPVTSLATLMLMEQGKLKLDDPISRWLPEFSDMQVLKDPAGDLADTYPAPREITVEDLLTHRSGLCYAFSAQASLERAYEEGLGSPLWSELKPDAWLAALGSLPLAYPPGERMHYSHATDVLGLLLGRIEGKTFDQVLRQQIFEPLGMVDTAFWVPPEKRERLAKLYKASPDGGPPKDASSPLPDKAPAFEGGGGGLFSTVDDYLKFARAMLGRGEADGVRLLKPATVELMTTNHLTPAQRAMPFLGLPFWESMGFGLGVSVVMDAAKHAQMGAASEGSFGWPGAFGTWWQADPVTGVILIYLIQDYVDLSAESVTATREAQEPTPSQIALGAFQKLAYAALR
jgi:CubicO group peptidase (beta-lactamase class C family)